MDSTLSPLPTSPLATSPLADVRARIASAARIASRKVADITLVAVSKTHEAEAILPLLAQGQRCFGENRVQEAAAKWPALRAAYGDVALHLVGQLQSNKAEEAVALFDCIHSLDRPSLAGALAHRGRALLCLAGQAGQGPWPIRALHGHERGFRGGDPAGRHPYPRGQRPVRGARMTSAPLSTHSGPLSGQAADLDALAARGRLRGLTPNRGVDFASNDYLGFATHPALAQAAQDALARGVPVGSGGSRLLRGNHPEHEALEAEAAAFFGGPGFSGSALFLPSGFTANSALLATMPQREDHIFTDALIHASVHEGLRLSRAPHTMVAHNDVGAFADALTKWRAGGGKGTPWIVVESL